MFDLVTYKIHTTVESFLTRPSRDQTKLPVKSISRFKVFSFIELSILNTTGHVTVKGIPVKRVSGFERSHYIYKVVDTKQIHL